MAAATNTTSKFKNRWRYYKGMDGIRYRSPVDEPVPSFKQDDPEHMQPQEVMDGHAKVFDLANDDDLLAYSKVIDRAAKGHYLLSAEHVHWSDKTQSFHAFLRWLSVWLEKPGAHERFAEEDE